MQLFSFSHHKSIPGVYGREREKNTSALLKDSTRTDALPFQNGRSCCGLWGPPLPPCGEERKREKKKPPGENYAPSPIVCLFQLLLTLWPAAATLLEIRCRRPNRYKQRRGSKRSEGKCVYSRGEYHPGRE